MDKYWEIRPLDACDVKDVLDQWIGTYRKSPWAGTIPNNKFRDVMKEAIGQLFARGSTGFAAVNPENPKHMIGWIVTETNSKDELVVHYLHVGDLHRGKGVAKDLLNHVGSDGSKPVIYTHKTTYSKKFNGKHIPEVARRKTA